MHSKHRCPGTKKCGQPVEPRNHIEDYYFGDTKLSLQPTSSSKPLLRTISRTASGGNLRRGISLSLNKRKAFEDFYQDVIFLEERPSNKPLDRSVFVQGGQPPFKSVYCDRQQNQKVDWNLPNYKTSDVYGNTNRATSCRSGGVLMDSQISLQEAKKQLSTNRSGVRNSRSGTVMARSLHSHTSQHETPHQKRRHQPIFTNKLSTPTKKICNIGRITSLAELPLNYSIILQEGNGQTVHPEGQA